MKAHLCHFRINKELRVLDCNPIARILLSIVDTPIETYLLQLLDDSAVAAARRWLMLAEASRPQRTKLTLMTRPNAVFGREAATLPVDIEVAVNGATFLHFDPDYLACTAKPFWMISAYLCALLNLNALVCDASGAVVAANFSDLGAPLERDAIRLHDCIDRQTCERIGGLLQSGGDELIWQLSEVMFTPASEMVFSGELLLFPLRIDGVLQKVLIIFREHYFEKVDLPGNPISVTSFIAAIESAMEGIAILDNEKRFIYQNRSHWQMFGYDTPLDLIGRDWSTLYEGDSQDFIEREVWPALHRDENWRGTLLAQRRDGTFFYQMTSAQRVPGIGYVGTSLDVTEWRQASDALQRSEAQLSAVVETARDAILTIDDDGIVLHWNGSAERLFGYSRDTMVGHDIARLLSSNTGVDASGVYQLLLTMPSAWPIQTIEMTLLNAAGEDVTVEASLSDWYNTEGKNYRTLIVRDIRERLRHAQQLVDTRDRLTRSLTQKQVYGEIFDFASSIMAIAGDHIDQVLEAFATAAHLSRCALYRVVEGADPVLEFIDATPAAAVGDEPEVRLALTPGELEEIREQRCFSYAPQARSALLDKLRRQAAHSAFFDNLSIVGNSSDYLLWCETSKAKLDERVVLMLELTALKLSACLESHARIEAAVRRTALENIGQIAAALAHDNNHFASIVSSNLHLLRKELTAANDLELIDDVLNALKSHQSLFTRLLGAARMDSYINELVDPDEVIARSIKLLRSTLPDSIRLSVEYSATAHTIDVDGAMFGSALFNLIINAYHACGTDGVITVSTHALGAWLDVTVRDNGCGIAPEILRRVTDPFYSTKRSNSGSGLGLFMVKNFCTQSGGNLFIESALGAGTTVTMRLPIIDGGDDDGSVTS
ncbi:MAG: PAS domain-containing sensor histidine kinase [Spongiibacteraceae bacterium]